MSDLAASPLTVRAPDHTQPYHVDGSGAPAGYDAAYTCDACGDAEEAADCSALGDRVLCYACTGEAQARAARYARRRRARVTAPPVLRPDAARHFEGRVSGLLDAYDVRALSPAERETLRTLSAMLDADAARRRRRETPRPRSLATRRVRRPALSLVLYTPAGFPALAA